MTYHIQPIARTLSPEQILEPTTTASPPRAGSPMELVYPAQVALQNRTSLETLFSLLDAFMPPNGASHPISETMCFINPTAYEKFSVLLQKMFSDQKQKQAIKKILQDQVLNIKSFEFFGCDYKHLSEEEKRIFPFCLAGPGTRTGHCLKILNEIAYDPALADIFKKAITSLEEVKESLSRNYFQDEADFERHVLNFEREGDQAIAEKMRAYHIVRQRILEGPMTEEIPGQIAFDIQIMRANMGQLGFHEYSFQLSYVPAELWALKDLTVLGLAENRLTRLPNDISQLNQLVSLQLNVNELTSLPSKFGLLTNLTDLDISYNQMVVFPPEVCELTNLTRLFCGGNPFVSLPAEIRKLTNLTFLHMHNNRLTTFPPEFKSLVGLRNLIASPSQIRVMPEVLVHCRNLAALYLDFPQFEQPYSDEVHEWILQLLAQGCDFNRHDPLNNA